MKSMILIIGILFMSTAWSEGNICSTSASTFRGGDDYWPWGFETKFPWTRISGVWTAGNANCKTLFIFKMKTNSRGEKLMDIVEYDPSSCAVISKGIGIEIGRIIYASMAGIAGKKSYDMALRAFNESDLTIPSSHNMSYAEAPGAKQVIVMHLYPKGKWDDRIGYSISKVSNKSEMICDNQ